MTFPDSTNFRQQQRYFPALTGVRALAAFLVFVHHVRPPHGKLPEIILKYQIAGHIGVTIFFVLSGFLISYRYAAYLEHNKIGFGKYMIRRVARIYPLYLVLSIIILLWKKDGSVWHWFLNLSLLKGYFNAEKFTGIAQGWSITVEETFYLAAPILFSGFRKFGWGAVLAILLTGAGLVVAAQAAGSDSFMANLNFMGEFTLFGRIFEFYCGHKLAGFLKNNPPKSRQHSLFTLTGSLLTFAGYSAVAFSHNLQFTFPFPFSPEIFANNFILPAGIAIWFYGLITERSWLQKLLSTKLFQVLGKSSYAFYLIHAGLFFELIYFHITPNKFITFIILNIWAIAIYYLFEEPVNQYLRRKSDAWELQKRMQQPQDFLSPKA